MKVDPRRTPKTPRLTTRSNGDATRERLLDAAETLFGEQTFAMVSLRDITRRAGVAPALASYHFGSKEAMFRECVARKASILSRLRREGLAALRPDADVDEILDAFMRPLYDQIREGNQSWPAFLRIVSRLAFDEQWMALLREHFDETAQMFLTRLASALPQASNAALLRGFALALDAMLQTLSRNRRVDSLSRGVVSADDLTPAYDALMRFSVAGLRALAS
jgi:AcrR family transcriptional regulator